MLKRIGFVELTGTEEQSGSVADVDFLVQPLLDC